MEQLLDTIFQWRFQVTAAVIAIFISHLDWTEIETFQLSRMHETVWLPCDTHTHTRKHALTLFDCRLRRTFSMRNLRNSIFALESASICCASANSFLSRPWWPLVIDCIIFSAPFFTFVSMLNCFSSDISNLSFGVKSGVKGDWSVSVESKGGEKKINEKINKYIHKN